MDRLRAAGVAIGVVSNQSGVARGLLTPDDVERVNRRVAELVGPVGTWRWCPHGPADGCGCRKPRAGLIHQAALDLGVRADRCVVVGDIGSDMGAARAAGAAGILVPTEVTQVEEIDAAPRVAADLGEAVTMILRGRMSGGSVRQRPAPAGALVPGATR